MYSIVVFWILAQIRLFRRICTQNCANTIQNRCFYKPSLSSIIYIYIIIMNSLEERVSGGTNSFHDTNLSQGFLCFRPISEAILDRYFEHKKRSSDQCQERGKKSLITRPEKNTRAVIGNCQIKNKKTFF